MMALLVMAFILGTFPLQSACAAQKDGCREKGVLIRNLSTRDLWYAQNNGPCTILVKDHSFLIKPGDKVGIFSDMICKTQYCRNKTVYKDFKAFDVNGDCRVKILPDCTLSDM
jgi:hypothetical protein